MFHSLSRLCVRSFRWSLLGGASLFASACVVESATEPFSEPSEGTATTNDYFTGALGEGDLTVLMVVDRSGSMFDSWEGVPKWRIAQTALDGALVGIEQELTIGALLFPLHSDCQVVPLTDPAQIQLQRAGSFKKRWETSGVSTPEGATPLGEAFRQADAAVNAAAERGLLEKRFRVVVITDGEPTCGDDPEEIVSIANGWRDRGVEVRVMGLPGSSRAAALLNRIAGAELFEDPNTGEIIIPDPGSSWDGDQDTGYIAPPSSDDVDDSLWHAVR